MLIICMLIITFTAFPFPTENVWFVLTPKILHLFSDTGSKIQCEAAGDYRIYLWVKCELICFHRVPSPLLLKIFILYRGIGFVYEFYLKSFVWQILLLIIMWLLLLGDVCYMILNNKNKIFLEFSIKLKRDIELKAQ